MTALLARPTTFQLAFDAWGRLVCTDADGREHVGVAVVRGFPITAPRQGLAVCDPHGRELVWIDDLDRLDAPQRAAVEAALHGREFMPILRRIVTVSSNVEPSEWTVETDRGPTRFLLSSEENVRRLPDDAALIVDANGVRYLIANYRALDATSRRLLERFIY